MCIVCDSAGLVRKAAEALTVACMTRLDAQPSINTRTRPQLRHAFPVEWAPDFNDLIGKLKDVP
jgi:hypothetical protein